MTVMTRKTAKLLCIQSSISRSKLPEEAQKLADLCDDPEVSPEQKKIVKARLDEHIKELEAKATTRRLKDDPEVGKV